MERVPTGGVVGGIIADSTRSRSELIAENALMRQQHVVASRAVKRPAFRVHERGLLVLLAGLVPLWRGALLLAKPETVLRWHRRGFQRNGCLSQTGTGARVDRNTQSLEQAMPAKMLVDAEDRIGIVGG